MTSQAPVITIDGPSGSGKGTISQMVADKLDWHILDSGALYRVLAWAALREPLNPDDKAALHSFLEHADIQMIEQVHQTPSLSYNGMEVADINLRTDEVSDMASRLAGIPVVRKNLMRHQRAMRRQPGLVADGRDMGTVIFPDAVLKFFLSADPAVRAQRRFNQLKEQGINVSLRDIQKELLERDRRDEHRAISPLKPAPDVIYLDTTDLNAKQVFSQVIEHISNYL